ncbi:MAG: FHA domain-containing protein [Desulfovibrio sp.]|nr:MAG: FHA domain-containing protein [Desulfovibrio sp.]
MAKLILKHNLQVIATHELVEGTTVNIGRKEGNDLMVEHLTVSGTHAKIDALNEGYLLSDLRSKNGTTVNGKRIEGSHWLADGDIIGIGTHTLTFSVSGDEEAFGIAEGSSHDATAVLDMDELMK